MKKQVGLSVACAALALMLSACNRSDTSMQEAFWCASYGTCKPSPQQQPARAQTYDTCSFYGICDRGS